VIHVSIQYQRYRNYTQSPNCIVTGEAFCNACLYKRETLHALVSSWEQEELFINGIRQLNGFYAVIKYNDHELWAAVDRVRSLPLFYGKRGQDFYLSDSAEWVRQQIGNTELDYLSQEEFILTGYVTGPDTLFPDVKQIQAGEALIVDDFAENITVKPIRYYRFIHKYEIKRSLEDFLGEHDHVLLKVFNRLIQQVDGRTAVVPLSGGYDSRLIVLMLKRLGYDNVITFSYGHPGNQESETSRKIAELLGLRWIFIPYSDEDWYKWFNSKERGNYWIYSGGLVSVPHNQDWPAVWQLKNNCEIPKDSVFVPGHSADLPAGSRSYKVPYLYRQKGLNTTEIIEAIINYHYSLLDWTKSRSEFKPLMMDKIKRTLGNIDIFPDSASAFESWDIDERQAKFIVNAVRVYEFWNYSWWLPFWDCEYMQFWSSVPVKFRINEAMYKTFVDNLLFDMTGFKLPGYDLKDSYKQRIKNALKPYISASVLNRLKIKRNYNIKSYKMDYISHQLANWGLSANNEDDLLKIMRQHSSSYINAFSASIYLKELMSDKLD
jgi:asparagine synthase (glutamine-hydrolysing)